MKVSIRKVDSLQKEQVVLECVTMTKEFEDIQEYVLAKGEQLAVYQDGNRMYRIRQEDILYIEAVGELVFAYTSEQMYEMKSRLYEMEQRLLEKKFVRCSKSVILNIPKVISIKPALNGRFLAEMENHEKIMISRQYAKNVKTCIMEEL